MQFARFTVATLLLAVASARAAGLDDTRAAEFARADEALNSTFQALLGRLPAPEKSKLQEAQRAWLQFRNLDCKWASPAEPLDCMIDRTSSRTAELRSSLFFDRAGSYGTLSK